MMETGFYRIDNDKYHDGPGISRSGLVRLLRSPAHYKTPVAETPTLRFGKLFHLAVLEPDKWTSEAAPMPQGLDARTKAGKAAKTDIEASGKEVVSYKDWLTISEMAMAIMRNKTARDLLKDGESEISGYWPDPRYPDILCKCRLDWINKPKRVIVDIKKTTDARQHPFTALGYRLGYHMEAAWYLYGATQITRIEHRDFYFICVEDTPPYAVQVYKAGDEMISEGLLDCARALEIYKRCLDTDNWPAYGDDVKDLGLPGWAKRKQDNAIYEGGF
jgi:hypothetical protein